MPIIAVLQLPRQLSSPEDQKNSLALGVRLMLTTRRDVYITKRLLRLLRHFRQDTAMLWLRLFCFPTVKQHELQC